MKKKAIDEQIIKNNFENWELEKIQLLKQIVEDCFYREPYFQNVFYNGELINLDSYIEWKNEDSLEKISFEIKTYNNNINLKQILEETERGVGTRGINPTGAMNRFKKNIIEEAKKIGFNKKEIKR